MAVDALLPLMLTMDQLKVKLHLSGFCWIIFFSPHLILFRPAALFVLHLDTLAVWEAVV